MFKGLPRKVKIGPFDVKVSVHDFDDPDTSGDWRHGVLSLRLSPHQPTMVFAADTVIHEITHAVYKLYGLATSDSEERVCTVLATGLTQVMRDNPQLVRWLAQAVK